MLDEGSSLRDATAQAERTPTEWSEGPSNGGVSLVAVSSQESHPSAAALVALQPPIDIAPGCVASRDRVRRKYQKRAGVPLTEEQRKLVLDHLHVAQRTARVAYRYWALAKRVSLEDCEGAAYYGLCLAAKEYDSSKGYPFHRECLSLVRAHIRFVCLRAGGSVSLPRVMPKEGEESSQAFDNAYVAVTLDHPDVREPQITSEDAAEMVDIQDLLSETLLPQEAEIVRLKAIEDISLPKVGKRLNLSHWQTWKLYSDAIAKLREKLTGEEVTAWPRNASEE